MVLINCLPVFHNFPFLMEKKPTRPPLLSFSIPPPKLGLPFEETEWIFSVTAVSIIKLDPAGGVRVIFERQQFFGLESVANYSQQESVCPR